VGLNLVLGFQFTIKRINDANKLHTWLELFAVRNDNGGRYIFGKKNDREGETRSFMEKGEYGLGYTGVTCI
jgi:hypothetical protein